MKKYVAPMVMAKIIIEKTDLMAASATIGGNAGVSIGTPGSEGEPGAGSGGQAKHFSVWGDDEE